VPLVALVGPPNSGKTTLFNQLTRLRQKVANYPGVTVEKHVGRARLSGGKAVDVVDLPGVHGFSARTLDERVTLDVLDGRMEGLEEPDAIVVIVDATRLEQHLMLVEPLLEFCLPTLLVLNMADEMERRGGALDDDALAHELGLVVTRTNARAGAGIDEVRAFLEGVKAHGPPPPPDRVTTGHVSRTMHLPMIDAFASRSAYVRRVLERARFTSPGPSGLTDKLDSIFLQHYLGPAIFLAVVVLVFQAIFTWAVPLMDGVEAGVAASGAWVGSVLPDSWFRSLLVDGVWAGVGAVLVFLPQILILFLFLGILEDSGYLARAAVIADRLMYRVGLQGRAFLPLLSGYACAVPAILAARTVEDERDRLATIFVTPFMTCSARLPVYALLIAAFIPARPVLGPLMGSRAAVLLGLYALGVVAAVGTAFLLKRTLLRAPRQSFIMELPPYRVPTLRSLTVRLIDRSRIFLRRAGRIILMVTVVLWILTQVPRTGGGPPPIDASALARIGQVIEPGTLGTIYGVEGSSEGSLELQEALQSHLSLGAAVALLVFFVFALQCMSTVAVMRRETAGWRWPTLQFTYMLVLAYVAAFAAYRLF
jgi:ferrous iron transport protein B